MKTKEELNTLKLECKKLDSKLRELSDDELDLVTGGLGNSLVGTLPGIQVIAAIAGGTIIPRYADVLLMAHPGHSVATQIVAAKDERAVSEFGIRPEDLTY